MNYIQQAFEQVIEDVRTPEIWYVCLMERAPYYGGPEEGGWYGSDTLMLAYKDFPNRLLAEAAKAAVEELARELEAESRKAFGEQCLREMSWLEARGLDADFLPEPDGPNEYDVIVSDTIPMASYGTRGYS